MEFRGLLHAWVCAALVSGCIGISKREDAIEAEDPNLKRASRRSTTVVDPESNLTRARAEMVRFRIESLFPRMYTSVYAPYHVAPLFEALGTPDRIEKLDSTRPYSTVMLMTARGFILRLCDDALQSAPTDITTIPLFKVSDATMPGETAPPVAQKTRRHAWALARQVWLFPYDAESIEVIELEKVLLAAQSRARTLRGVADTAPFTDADFRAGLRASCATAFLSPQFWLGNTDSLDAVRRIALNVGGRAPTFTEYSKVKSGELTLRDYARFIQNDPGSRPGYIRTATEWHLDWLKVRDMTRDPFMVGVQDPREVKSLQTASSLGTLSHVFVTKPAVSPATGNDVVTLNGLPIIDISDRAGQTDLHLGGCDHTKVQAFDPAVGRIEWQHFNHVSGNWDTIGTWKKNLANGQWDSLPGSVNWVEAGVPRTVVTDMTDLKAFTSIARPAGTVADFYFDGVKKPVAAFVPTQVNRYTFGRLMGTPVDHFIVSEFRFRRFTTPDGTEPQDGMSEVTLWWSGQKAFACNALNRYISTCAFRASTFRGRWGHRYPMDDPTPSRRGAGILAADRHLGMLNIHLDSGTFVLKRSLVHPGNFEEFACGIPDPSLAGTEANELAAFPRTAPYRDLVAYTPLGRMYPAPNGTIPEIEAIRSVRQDFSDEPKKLIEEIISGDLPHTKLLTADWSWGRSSLELLYRSQGYNLPAYPAGTYTRPDGTEWSKPTRKFNASGFTTIDRKWMRSRLLNEASRRFGPSMTEQIPDATGDVEAKPMSGVLTMPAYLRSEGGKMRAAAAKIFRTFTCKDMPSLTLSDSAVATHAPFVPTRENNGSLHLDKSKGCFTCHIHMDPLASALSTGFLRVQGNTSTLNIVGETTATTAAIHELLDPAGEFGVLNLGGETSLQTIGIRSNSGKPSQGAVLGKSVSGVRAVAQTLAESTEYSQCVVQRAFEGTFGRTVGFGDNSLIKRFNESFRGEWNYSFNRLVEELVSSKEFLDE